MLQKQALRFQSWRQFYFLLLNKEQMEAEHGYDIWRAIYDEYGDPAHYLGPDDIGNWKKKESSYSKLSKHVHGDLI